MSNPAENVIRKCGGHQVVADWLGVDVTRVYRWTYPRERGGTGGLVPTKHQSALLERARQEGIPLEPADFFEKPTPPFQDHVPASAVVEAA